MSFVLFHFVNCKGEWAHLAKKIHNQELKSLQYLNINRNTKILLKHFNGIIIKNILKISVLL